MLLTEGLAAYGLKVDCAATAEQAMSLVLGTKYDAILCDLKLSGSGPNADGYGVAQRLKIASGENKPEVIYMSGDLVSEEGGQAARQLPSIAEAFSYFRRPARPYRSLRTRSLRQALNPTLPYLRAPADRGFVILTKARCLSGAFRIAEGSQS